jgi:hypothetical protein
VFFSSLDGVTTIVAASREYEPLAENSIGEPVSASPASAAGRLFLRGDKHLFCIGGKQAST